MAHKLSVELKKVVQNAVSIAKTRNDAQLRPEHIMLSIIEDKDSYVTSVLGTLGLDLNQVFESLSTHLNDINLPNGILLEDNAILPHFITKEVLAFADREAKKLNVDETDVIHLLLGILSVECVSKEILEESGIKYETVYNQLAPTPENALSSFHDDDSTIKDSKSNKKESKTPVLDNFCTDLTKAAEDGILDPIVGRKLEIRRIGQILSRKKKNNPVIIGEAGVGKTAVVEGLAQLIVKKEAPRNLLGKRILVLDLASVVAGTKYRGQFEERMKAILEELKANPDVIVFIDELHTLVGSGNASGSMDGANMFKPALARGEIQVIGATTLSEFRENIETDAALTRRFQQVIVNETTIAETKEILINVKERYEIHHQCKYSDEAIDECVNLAHRYITDRAMPDKALDVLDEAGASTNSDIVLPPEITSLDGELEMVKEEKILVVQQQEFEKAADLRKREKEIIEKISDLKKKWNEDNDNLISPVDVDTVGEVISMMTGIPLNKISSKEIDQLTTMANEMEETVIGQNKAVAKVVKALKRNRLGIKDEHKPIGSFIFLGPTGVGKTYLAKMLAEYVFGSEDALVRIDMSEYQHSFNVTKLIGSPPGYVGHEKGGQLTEIIRKKPYAVVLLDEIEKAHPDVFKTLLQLLDEGHLTDGLGRKIDFKNTLIIMTSNIGIKESMDFGPSVGFETESSMGQDEDRIHGILEKALKKKFPPEFLNRIDDTIIFNTLSKDDIVKIIRLELNKLIKRVEGIGYKMVIKDSAIQQIAEVGYDIEYGARPLNRAIQDLIQDELADKMLDGITKVGDTLTFTYNKTKEKIEVKVKK